MFSVCNWKNISQLVVSCRILFLWVFRMHFVNLKFIVWVFLIADKKVFALNLTEKKNRAFPLTVICHASCHNHSLPSSSRSRSFCESSSLICCNLGLSTEGEPKENVAGWGDVDVFKGLWSWKICELAKTWRISGAKFTPETWISLRTSFSWILQLKKDWK